MIMKTKIQLVASLLLVVAACGDNQVAPDARVRPDTGGSGGFPAAPTLGTQIDRMGRPTINTLLNHGFDPAPAAQTAKDAYNANSMPATWVQYVPEFAKTLGILDALDTGFCGNGRCEANEGVANPLNLCTLDCGATGTGAGDGCGNQALYNGGQGTTPGPMSYFTLAGILALDELYLDTSKTQCGLYLAVEFGQVSPVPNSTCGGRSLQSDVVDFSLSLTAIGIPGFSTDGMFTPKIQDGAPPHTDYLADFPYLGNPH
jgi:hypothetical protein